MQQQESNDGIDREMLMWFGLVIIRAWAIVFEVFLHRGMGMRYPGIPGLVVLLLMPVYLISWQGYDLGPTAMLLPAFLVACVVQRSLARLRKWRGQPMEHSNYNGYPIFCSLFGLPEQLTKGLVEPVLVGLVGLLSYEWNQPFGIFLLIGAASLFICAALSRAQVHQQAHDMHDAIIMQEQLAERFRQIRNGR